MSKLIEWKMLHPKMSIDHLGFIPCWFIEGDLRRAEQVIDDCYRHGGGFRQFKGFALRADNSIKYPGDPILKPLASAQYGDELLVFYDSAFLAIIQPDRSFQITRVD